MYNLIINEYLSKSIINIKFISHHLSYHAVTRISTVCLNVMLWRRSLCLKALDLGLRTWPGPKDIVLRSLLGAWESRQCLI